MLHTNGNNFKTEENAKTNLLMNAMPCILADRFLQNDGN